MIKEMAVKFINIRQEGEFRHSGRVYKIIIEKKSGAEVYSFYNEKGTLVSSVFTKYLSKAVGVKKAGEFERSVYGNFETYITFINYIDEIRSIPSSKLVSERKLIMDDNGYFVDQLTRKGKHLDNNSGETHTIFHTQQIQEGNIISEKVQKLTDNLKEIFSIEYTCIAQGASVKANKIKGIEYQDRESGNSDIRTIQVKTLDMLLLEGKDLEWVKKKNYRLLKTKEEFEEYLARMDKHTSEVGFDTETTGLRINMFPRTHPKRDNLVGICISLEDNEGVYIPVRHKLFENLDEDYVIESLRPYLDENSEKKKSLVTHYGSFDWKVLYSYGISLNIENDTYILQYMINNSDFRGNKKLKDLAHRELDMDMIELDELFIKTKGRKLNIDFSMLPEEPVRNYAPADADATRLLFKKKIPDLLPTMRFLYWIEIELMKYIAHMEYHGMKLDLELLVELTATAEKEKERLRQAMFKLVGREFNPNSNKEVPKIMYEDLGYPILFHTDTGAPSIGKHALKLLSNEKKDHVGKKEKLELEDLKYPLAKLLSDYKAQEKLINGFLTKMLNENTDGYIFPHFNQTGTDSGRISCSGPKCWAVA